MKFSHLILILSVLLSTASMSTYACTCVRNNKWKLKDELNFVSLVVKGKVISVTDYTDSEFPGSKKLFRLIIENRYKSPVDTPDTVSIITGHDGASCGYEFKVGKEYIVYATNWEQKNAIKNATETSLPGMFYTDICTSTKETNLKELAKLKRLAY